MTFGAAEHRILDMFKIGTRFIFDDIEYVVTVSGKPTCSKGVSVKANTPIIKTSD